MFDHLDHRLATSGKPITVKVNVSNSCIDVKGEVLDCWPLIGYSTAATGETEAMDTLRPCYGMWMTAHPRYARIWWVW
jgi:hypothetical protein